MTNDELKQKRDTLKLDIKEMEEQKRIRKEAKVLNQEITNLKIKRFLTKLGLDFLVKKKKRKK